jgi:hypothetical protein
VLATPRPGSPLSNLAEMAGAIMYRTARRRAEGAAEAQDGRTSGGSDYYGRISNVYDHTQNDSAYDAHARTHKTTAPRPKGGW